MSFVAGFVVASVVAVASAVAAFVYRAKLQNALIAVESYKAQAERRVAAAKASVQYEVARVIGAAKQAEGDAKTVLAKLEADVRKIF